MDQKCDSSSREPGLQAWSPEFKPQSWKEGREEEREGGREGGRKEGRKERKKEPRVYFNFQLLKLQVTC
jgi:hypothetical protein